MTPRVVCAWCVKAGLPGIMSEGSEPVSHGICEAHVLQMRAEMAAAKLQRATV